MKTNGNEKLKVGDVIYGLYHGKPNSVDVIERVTKTQAITKSGNKFRLEYSTGYLHEIGKDRWSFTSYYAETPELKQKFDRHSKLKRLRFVDFESLSDTVLDALIEALNKE